MSEANDIKARLVPAICTQCGAKLEVDPTHDAAVCPYCNTPFIVEKAVQNYSVQNAKIEHVDTVKVDMKGAADSLFGFLGEQMSESREARREERRERRAESREINMAFIKLFTYMMIGMFALAAIAFIVMQFRGDSGQEETGAPGEAQSITETVPENASGNGTGASYEVEFAAEASAAPVKPARQVGERFEASFTFQGVEQPVRYEHIRSDAVGFEMDFDYESFKRLSEAERERFVSVWDDPAKPENYIDVSADTGEAALVADAITAQLSGEFDVTSITRELDSGVKAIRLEASVLKGTNLMADNLQSVYVVPASDGCRIAWVHCVAADSEGFSIRVSKMLNTLTAVDRK